MRGDYALPAVVTRIRRGEKTQKSFTLFRDSSETLNESRYFRRNVSEFPAYDIRIESKEDAEADRSLVRRQTWKSDSKTS